MACTDWKCGLTPHKKNCLGAVEKDCFGGYAGNCDDDLPDIDVGSGCLLPQLASVCIITHPASFGAPDTCPSFTGTATYYASYTDFYWGPLTDCWISDIETCGGNSIHLVFHGLGPTYGNMLSADCGNTLTAPGWPRLSGGCNPTWYKFDEYYNNCCIGHATDSYGNPCDDMDIYLFDPSWTGSPC